MIYQNPFEENFSLLLFSGSGNPIRLEIFDLVGKRFTRINVNKKILKNLVLEGLFQVEVIR